MTELMMAAASAVTSSYAGTAVRDLKLLLLSGLGWLAAVSLWTGRSPGRELQSAIDWCGLSWSITPALTWLDDRSDALAYLVVVLMFVIALGVRRGLGEWLANGRVLGGTMVGILLALEIGIPTVELTVLVLLASLCAAVRERSLITGFLFLVAPWLLLLLVGPGLFLNDLLGLSSHRRLDPRRSLPSVEPKTGTVNAPVSTREEGIQPQVFRPYTGEPSGEPALTRLREGPPPPGSTRRRSRRAVTRLGGPSVEPLVTSKVRANRAAQ
ncbi:hypothetical protein HPO96_35150 [Kribbella sandramycini]|uniref:Uncharacterized protein n=1 Tax=Kribbella sandramycini TaxID=60450 RepID=A0A7Y4P3W3_9ACTN|nr:hypothetical protein [Kribbella sandramycini]MBB6566712.1 hypothetical protein [Kribbella sandramycini]NOL45498.1 hypothetical protein [Kribbella sandramycini]